ncbi:MAG: caspase family protein [Acidobacteriia bacterium]|nr:caspase family protein [Terriglobia bacterium]
MRCTLALWALSLALCAQPTAPLAQPARDLRIESAEPVNPLQDRGTRWALVVGISSYEHLPPGAQLHFAHRDAEEFAEFLRSFAGGALPAGHIRLLENEHATLVEIRAALDTWLVALARPADIVYVFFAGHGVLDDQDEGYFVAHDSDPQNLHATALAFRDVDSILSNRLRAGLVVLVTDACHTGRLGWSTYAPGTPSRAAESLAKIGQGDRSFLKLLATRPSEQSFEDQRWDGGHGVFTYVLLEGLRGEADRDGDHVVRAAEAIDYLSRRVPELTGSRQHPRVAGTFDGQVAIALAPNSVTLAPRTVTLDVSGPASSAVYVDNIFRGKIRPTGTLRIDSLRPGPHAIAADFVDGTTIQGTVTLGNAPGRVSMVPPAPSLLTQLRTRLDAGQVLEANGAWDFYRSHTFAGAEQIAATTWITGALEGLGQACVGDYVQSTANGPKRAMLERAVDAYEKLKLLRPNDSGLEVRQLFCRGRLQIAERRFAEAAVTLETAIRRDLGFACAYNALGVALARLNRPKEARQAFETASRLTPEWALPPFQIASQLIASGDLERARPYLEKAVAFNPRSVGTRWSLLHLERLLGRMGEVERQGAELIRLDPNYAPTYLELGQAYEAGRNFAKAVEAYDTYTLLAPNFADTNAVRNRADRLRSR